MNTENDIINNYKQSIHFWESKRMLYNLITISGGGCVIFLRGFIPNGISSYCHFSILFYWLFGANIIYTFGWVLEMLLNYYFKIKFWGTKIRLTLFILGSIFSFIWIFLLTREIP